MNKLSYIRNDEELKTLRKIGATQAFANFTWSTTPFLVSCSTFTVFVLVQDKPLTTDIVFPALTLFNLLTFPLAILPMVITCELPPISYPLAIRLISFTAIIEASVAVTRLTDYFAAEELQPDAIISQPAAEKNGEETIRIRDGSFTWNKTEGRTTLEDINLSARKGDLICVVGRVGAGKSSLLQAILGDLWKLKGDVTVHGAPAYVAQSPWVMNASVKDNITFGHRWDPHFYDKTVKACALLEDFAALPDRDDTEVGERGISLSGGQKARLTLARAVYARADVYLLDDCLSAVDQHVGRHLINEVFGPKGLLQGKTRILATNSIPVLEESDYIVLLKEGKIAEEGTYDHVMSVRGGEVAALIRTAAHEQEKQQEETSSTSGSVTLPGDDGDSEDDDIEEVQEGLTELAPIKPHASTGRAGSSGSLKLARETTLRKASTASFRGPRGKAGGGDDEEAGLKSKQSKETTEQGKVKWSVYGEYAKTSNLGAVAIYMATLLGAQTAQIGTFNSLMRLVRVEDFSNVIRSG